MYDMSTIPAPLVRSHSELRGLLTRLSITGRSIKAEADCSDALVSRVLHGHRQSERVAEALVLLARHPRWSPSEAASVGAQIRSLCGPEAPTKTPADARPEGEATRGRPAEPSACDGGQCQPATPPRRLTRRAPREVSAVEGTR